MTHKELMTQSLCKFQFTPTSGGSYGIDTNFNFYFIHIDIDKTSISMIKRNLVKISKLNHSMPFMTFESEVTNKTITIIAKSLKYPTKLQRLCRELDGKTW